MDGKRIFMLNVRMAKPRIGVFKATNICRRWSVACYNRAVDLDLSEGSKGCVAVWLYIAAAALGCRDAMFHVAMAFACGVGVWKCELLSRILLKFCNRKFV